MGRITTESTARLSLSVQQRVLELGDKEASLIGMERSSFMRLLIGRAMGIVPLDRSSEAPRRDRFSVPKKGPEMSRLELMVRPDYKLWIENLAIASGVPVSSLLTLLILDWAGINPVAACFAPTRRGGREKP